MTWPEPSALSRAPHRTGARAHGLADILAYLADRGYGAGARRRRKPGLRSSREGRHAHKDSGARSPWRVYVEARAGEVRVVPSRFAAVVMFAAGSAMPLGP